VIFTDEGSPESCLKIPYAGPCASAMPKMLGYFACFCEGRNAYIEIVLVVWYSMAICLLPEDQLLQPQHEVIGREQGRSFSQPTGDHDKTWVSLHTRYISDAAEWRIPIRHHAR
jgi:hypothetical protein